MKKFAMMAGCLAGTLTMSAQGTAKQMAACELGVTINNQFSKASRLDSIMASYTAKYLPGTAMAVYSEKEGWWAGAKGFSKVEEQLPMQNCHLQYIQSISKMYMAASILLLKEEGKIKLDAPMNDYLPAMYQGYIKKGNLVTVRMLLNHRSGIAEYNTNPGFISQVVQHPLTNFSAKDCLASIAAEESEFKPGTKYVYRNTNYLLLSLIADAITGDHAAYIQKKILKPLGLHNTFYGKGFNYLQGLNVPDCYWDILNSGKPANFSLLQQTTVVSSKGDDGIVCTPVDAVKFLKGLMEGKLLNPSSLQEMLDFVKDEKGEKRYGMGMIYFDLGGLEAYGHGGGGIGAGCGLLYIPSQKLYTFFSVNLGVFVENDLAKKADEMKTAILGTLLQ